MNQNKRPRGKRIDQHEPGEDIAKGYVSHAKPIEAQREYVRQTARKVGGEDRALLVDMLLGETTQQTAAHYAAAIADHDGTTCEWCDKDLQALMVEALDDQRLRRQLQILDGGADVWCQANPAIGTRLHGAIVDELAA